MCVVRWSDRLNDLIHIRHWNGFWPANIYSEWLRWCITGWWPGRDILPAHTCVVITLLTRVYSDVAGELITPREPSVALRHRAGVRPLVHRGLARPVGILPGPHWHQSDGEVALLVHLALRVMNQVLLPVKIQKRVNDVNLNFMMFFLICTWLRISWPLLVLWLNSARVAGLTALLPGSRFCEEPAA